MMRLRGRFPRLTVRQPAPASGWLGCRPLAWEEELPALAGHGDYLPLLAATLAEYGVTAPVEAVYQEVWQKITVIEETFELVDALRRSGYGVHLGTNQERHRAAYMRTALGYDARFDVSCYSCELGVAKPDAGFFSEAVRRIGAPPEAVLFIDDSEKNVAGAQAAGLTAVQWEHGQGHPALSALLAEHGVTWAGADAGGIVSGGCDTEGVRTSPGGGGVVAAQ